METVFPLTVESESGDKHFASIEDLESFLQELADAYEWLPESIDFSVNLRNFLNNKILTVIRNQAAQAVANEQAEQPFAQPLQEVNSRFKLLLTGDTIYLLPGSERLEYCKRLSQSDPELGAATLFAMMRPEGTINKPNLLTRGHVAATLYQVGLTDHDVDFPKASDLLLHDAQKTLDEITESRIAADSKLRIFKKQSTKRRLNQRKEFKELLDHTSERWAALEETYEKKLALNYSVSYWDRKASEYGRNSWLFGVAAAVFASIFAYMIGWQAVELFEVIAESKTTRWYQISIVAVYATIGIWIIRLLTRSLMANMHLKVDAEHRVTMITTYLALLKEGRGLVDDDRRLIVEALFRPVQTGLVGGESSGKSLVEQIASLLTRRGS